jgi:predicted 2-oxoglutarate/Fe(II)-dependent dioxygenase YbiX
MPRADFFSKFNQLVVIRKFFDAATCDALVREAEGSRMTQAPVIRHGTDMLDTTSRNSLIVKISKETSAFIKSKLASVQSLFEERFHTELAEIENPSVLKYQAGNFFKPHKDRSELGGGIKRRVSMVIFLNDESVESRADAYQGGQLCLYGLVDDPRWQNYGFPLEGEKGLLIAFPSETLHEVKAVTEGQRYTVVSWFLAGEN